MLACLGAFGVDSVEVTDKSSVVPAARQVID